MVYLNHKYIIKELGDCYATSEKTTDLISSKRDLPTEYQKIIEEALNKLGNDLLNAASKNFLIEELSFYFSSNNLSGVIPVLLEARKDAIEHLYNDLKNSNLLRK